MKERTEYHTLREASSRSTAQSLSSILSMFFSTLSRILRMYSSGEGFGPPPVKEGEAWFIPQDG